MKYILSLILFACLCLSPAKAAEKLTFLGCRGDIWSQMDQISRLLYVQAFFDGLLFSKLNVCGDTLSKDISVPQYVEGVSTFYKDSKNSQMPVAFVLAIVSLKKSEKSEEFIEKAIKDYQERADILSRYSEAEQGAAANP